MRAAVSALDTGTSRRSFLVRFVIGASALAVAPVRYLTQPETAWSVVTSHCNNCSPSSRCCSSGTSCFCCTITGSNNCPSGSQRCGWWRCSSNGITYIDCCSGCSGHMCCGGSCGNRKGCVNPREYANCGCAGSSCACVTQNTIKCRITRRTSGAPTCCWGSALPGNCDAPPACAAV